MVCNTAHLRVSLPSWVSAFCEVLGRADSPCFVVGGAVRDLLLGHAVHDYDLATALAPAEVASRARAAGFRVIATGVEHGTVTVIVGSRRVEVTTFRRDVRCDGRRATVAFGAGVEEDAWRRDFTVNALYADKTGRVTDVVGGLADLAARTLRFIGDAETRLSEDWLRALRYMRLRANYGFAGVASEERAVAAALAHLEKLSRERIVGEWLATGKANVLDRGLLDFAVNAGVGRFSFPRLAWRSRTDPLPRLLGEAVASAWGQTGHPTLRCALLLLAEAPAEWQCPVALEGLFAAERFSRRDASLLALVLQPERFVSSDSRPETCLDAFDRIERQLPLAEWLRVVVPVWQAREPTGRGAMLAQLRGAEIALRQNYRLGLALKAGSLVAEVSGLTPGPQLGRARTWMRRCLMAGVFTPHPEFCAKINADLAAFFSRYRVEDGHS